MRVGFISLLGLVLSLAVGLTTPNASLLGVVLFAHDRGHHCPSGALSVLFVFAVLL